MVERECLQLRLMTYNIGGGRSEDGSNIDLVSSLIKGISPDILGVQEVIKKVMSDNLYSEAQVISESLGYENSSYFGPTLSFKDNFHIDKSSFVNGIFSNWEDWMQGNAIISRWPFIRFGDTIQLSEPRNIPLFHPPQYLGNRDTDSRHVILARVGFESLLPFVLVTHFTTLLGEHRGKKQGLPGKTEEAQKMRWQQSGQLLKLIQKHLVDKGELVFLLGDFNATESEPCISNVLEKQGGFTLLLPEKKVPTHENLPEPIDHILIYPGNRRIEYKCWVVNDHFNASDHNPVVADLRIYEEHSTQFQELGPGVARIE